jgi:O-antigen/teichoic acid export membrane protein
LIKRFSLYALTSLVCAVIGFFITIYLTRHLSPSDFGYIGIYGILIYVLNPLMTFNSSGLVSINIINYTKNEYRNFIDSFISLFIIIASILLVSVLIVGYVLPKYWVVIIASLIISFLTILLNIHYIELVQEKKVKVYSKMKLYFTITTSLLTLILVGLLKMAWEGRLLSIIFASFLVCLLMYKTTFSSLKNYSWNFDKNQIKSILNFGYPLVIGIGAAWIITQADKYIVLKYFDLESLGYYSLAYIIGMKITILNTSMVNAISPQVFTALKNKIAKNILRKYSLLYNLFLIIFTFCAIIFFKYFGIKIIGKTFSNSIPIIMLILIAGGFDGAYRVHGLVIEYFKETKLKTIIAYIIAGINILVSILLIPKYGILAPAIGTIIAFMLNYILTYIFALKILKRNMIN